MGNGEPEGRNWKDSKSVNSDAAIGNGQHLAKNLSMDGVELKGDQMKSKKPEVHADSKVKGIAQN